jgi:hypothetical protein
LFSSHPCGAHTPRGGATHCLLVYTALTCPSEEHLQPGIMKLNLRLRTPWQILHLQITFRKISLLIRFLLSHCTRGRSVAALLITLLFNNLTDVHLHDVATIETTPVVVTTLTEHSAQLLPTSSPHCSLTLLLKDRKLQLQQSLRPPQQPLLLSLLLAACGQHNDSSIQLHANPGTSGNLPSPY